MTSSSVTAKSSDGAFFSSTFFRSTGAAARFVVDWLFRDRDTGKLVVAQWPNRPLAVWFGFWLAQMVFTPSGAVKMGLLLGAGIALTVWSIGELVNGVNPWRRFLGAAVLIGWLLF